MEVFRKQRIFDQTNCILKIAFQSQIMLNPGNFKMIVFLSCTLIPNHILKIKFIFCKLRAKPFQLRSKAGISATKTTNFALIKSVFLSSKDKSKLLCWALEMMPKHGRETNPTMLTKECILKKPTLSLKTYFIAKTRARNINPNLWARWRMTSVKQCNKISWSIY